MVREGWCESKAKVLLLIDLKSYLWLIGEAPNTLVHIQLRFDESLANFLIKNDAVTDVIVCSKIMPKIITNTRNVDKTLYKVFSIIDTGKGCYSSINSFVTAANYLDKESSQYDLTILVTNPILLALESPENLLELGVTFEKLFIAMPMFKYSNYIDQSTIFKLLNGISKTLGNVLIGIEFSKERFELLY